MAELSLACSTHERSGSELSATEGRRVDFDGTRERRRDEDGDGTPQVRFYLPRQRGYPCWAKVKPYNQNYDDEQYETL